jgi:hypothetical protein
MSTVEIEPIVEDAPHTRRCRRCDVEINAASARCPLCGARQFRRQPILGWRGALICLVAVAAAVYLTRTIVLSGRPVSYLSYRSGDLVTLVPSTYHDLFPTAPHGTAIGEWADGAQPLDTETVQATMPAVGTPRSRIDSLARSLARQPGVAVAGTGPLTVYFAGGLAVPTILYQMGGADYETFDFDSCSHAVAVTVTLSAASQGLLQSLSLVLPQSANAICDGPDFSDQDRADAAIPLSLPR